MPDVYVTRHGERWSLRDDRDGEPVSEYATRAEAESAARALQRDRGGGDVVVQDDDPTGLAGTEDPAAGEPEQTPADRGDLGAPAPDPMRQNQAGL